MSPADDPPTGIAVTDRRGRDVLAYRINLDKNGRPVPELVLHLNYGNTIGGQEPQEFWTWADGRRVERQTGDVKRYWPKKVTA